MPHSPSGRYTLLTLFCALCGSTAACADSSDRLIPEVSTEEGFEIARLPALPSPLDKDWLWEFQAVQEVFTVHAAEDEPLLYQPRSLKELRSGHLLVHDPSAAHPLVIVDPSTQSAVARFGRSGPGPGELSNQVALGEAGDTLVVADLGNVQLHRFTRAGEWLGSQRLALPGWPMSIGVLPGPRADEFLVMSLNQDPRDGATWFGFSEVRASPGSSALFARFPEPLPGPAGSGMIQRGRRLWTVLPDHVVTMWSADPAVSIFDYEGRLVRRIDLPLSQGRLTARDIEREVARVGGIARTLEPGPRALTNMLYAAGDSVFGIFLSNLWRAAEDPPINEGGIYWRLFTTRGEYLGVVRQPEDFLVLGRGEGTIWARLLDEIGNPVLTELDLVRVR